MRGDSHHRDNPNDDFITRIIRGLRDFARHERQHEGQVFWRGFFIGAAVIVGMICFVVLGSVAVTRFESGAPAAEKAGLGPESSQIKDDSSQDPSGDLADDEAARAVERDPDSIPIPRW